MNNQDKHEAFLAVVQAHKGILYKIANSYCRNADDRQDLIQEIILQLWLSFDRYSGQFKLSTWVYRIALNTAISSYRKYSRKSKISSELNVNTLDFADSMASPETTENLHFLQHFIDSLNHFDRALMLLYLEEKTQAEMAEILGITITNVATRISRIKQKLKQKFSMLNS